jgi:hypothetical protein
MLAWLFPMPYFVFDGGWRVLRIVLVADLVVGPLCTFAVYRRGKRGLAFDLWVIGIAQVAALTYGIATMVLYRPQFLVYLDGDFHVVSMPQVRAQTRDLGRVETLRRHPVTPVVLGKLDDPASVAELTKKAFLAGFNPAHVGDAYAPLDAANLARIAAAAKPIDAIAKSDPEVARDVELFLARRPGDLSRWLFIPMIGGEGIVMGIFERATGELVDWML